MKYLGWILAAVLLLGLVGARENLAHQRQVIKLRDIDGSMSPSAARDWAVKAKDWFEKSRTLLQLVNSDKWSYSDERLVNAHRKQLAIERRQLDGLCGEHGAASEMIKNPYDLVLSEATFEGLEGFQQQMDRLEYIESLNGFQGHMSTEMFVQLEDHGKEGIDLQMEIFKERTALMIWYEQTAGSPSW